jgi:predicted dehydrogenase
MKKIKFAFIGGGNNSNIGRAHLRALNSSGKWTLVSGLFSRNKKNNFTEFNDENIRKYSDIESFISKEKNKIDVVILLTPPKENFRILKKLLEIKKPIICEKPVLNSLIKAKEINNIIKKNNIFFRVAYNYSGYPALKEIKNLLKKKEILKINIDMPQQGLFLSNSKIKTWRLKDENLPTLYLDLGSHIFNLCFFLLGKYPYKISSINRSYKKKDLVDDANFWCKFSKNIDGNFWISKFAGGNNNSLKINIVSRTFSILWEHQNPDTIIYSNNNGEQKIINRSNQNLKYMNNKKYNTYMAGHPTGYLETFVNFYNDIYDDFMNKNFTSKIDGIYNFEHCYKIIKILTSAKIASKKENWVKIWK